MRIVVIPYTHTLSHISRPLAVALELRRRGHEILFAGESPRKSFIEREGFEVIPLHEPDPELLFGNIRGGRLRFASDAEIAAMIEGDLALYRATAPDLVLTDGRFSAAISTAIAGIPHAAIVNVSSTQYRAQPYIPFFNWVPEPLAGGRLGGMLDRVNLSLEMLVFDNVMSVFKSLSRRHRLRRTVTATNCLAGNDLTLLADIPEYFPTRNLPADYHYVGPLTWKSESEAPSWWPPPGDAPLVYVTMGTTGIGDFFRTAAELFEKSGITAVITTGGQPHGARPAPGKVYLEEYLDGDLVMESCAAVVCHGGNGTVYQALQHGRPVLGIPTIPDQEFNMRRVEALGVGRCLSWREFRRRPQSLTEEVAALCADDLARERAQGLQRILSGYDAPRRAADLVEALAR